MAQLGCEGCDQLSQCHTKKLTGDWRGLQPCPMCLLPVQPSCLPNSCLRLIEVTEWIQGEDLGKCLPRAKHHLQCQCCTGHQPLQVTVTGCSWLVKESHITDHIIWIQLLTSTHTMLPSLQNQHQEELAPIHLCLPTFPIPRHSLTQGRWGFGLTPPWGHPLPPRHWNTGKYRSTKTLVWSQGSITVFLRDICLNCLRWSLLLGCCDTVRFTGNRLTPSIPKRQGTINTSLFLILLPSTFGLFSSTFVLYSSSGVQPTYIFFFQTAFKRQKASLGWTLAVCPQLQPQAPMFSSTSRDLLQPLKWNLLGYAWKCISLC